jgi:hypothetical protein
LSRLGEDVKTIGLSSEKGPQSGTGPRSEPSAANCWTDPETRRIRLRGRVIWGIRSLGLKPHNRQIRDRYASWGAEATIGTGPEATILRLRRSGDRSRTGPPAANWAPIGGQVARSAENDNDNQGQVGEPSRWRQLRTGPWPLRSGPETVPAIWGQVPAIGGQVRGPWHPETATIGDRVRRSGTIGDDRGTGPRLVVVLGNRGQVRRPGTFALTGRVILGSIPRG